MLRSEKHRDASIRRAVPSFLLVLLLLAGAVTAQAQPGEFPDLHLNLGTVGMQGLATVAPSLLYRPIDMLSVRPGGDAMGMGGAYTASATGAMALGWNPAGLATLERTAVAFDGISLSTSGAVGDYPDSFLIPQSPPLLISSYDVNLKGGFDANYLAVGTPLLHAGSVRVVGGIAWRRFANIAFPEETVAELTTAQVSGFPIVLSFDRSEKGSIDALTPGLAFQVGSKLALGLSYNVLDGTWRGAEDIRLTVVGTALRGDGRSKMKYSGGVPEFGIRLTPTDRIQIAARFAPGFDLRARAGTYTSRSVNAPGTARTISTARIADYDLTVPSALSAGVAVRPIPRLLLAADLTSQSWSEARAKYKEPINLLFPMQNDRLPLADVQTIGFGAEYLLKEFGWVSLPVRVGFRTAPQGFRQVSAEDMGTVMVPTNYGLVATPASIGEFNGKEVKGSAVSFGLSLRTSGIDYDFGLETLSYSFDKWFFDSPADPLSNPRGVRVKTDRSLTRLRFSASHSF